MPDQPPQNSQVDLMAPPSKEDLEYAKLMAPPSKEEIEGAKNPKDNSVKSLLAEFFLTGHGSKPGKEPIEPTTAAQVLAPSAIVADAVAPNLAAPMAAKFAEGFKSALPYAQKGFAYGAGATAAGGLAAIGRKLLGH